LNFGWLACHGFRFKVIIVAQGNVGGVFMYRLASRSEGEKNNAKEEQEHRKKRPTIGELSEE
jgi:hypothetical protein